MGRVFTANTQDFNYNYSPTDITTQAPNAPRNRFIQVGSFAGEPVDAYIKQSIVDPNAVVVSGFQSGVMPTTFGKTLSPEELDALVAFLSGKEAK